MATGTVTSLDEARRRRRRRRSGPYVSREVAIRLLMANGVPRATAVRLTAPDPGPAAS